MTYKQFGWRSAANRETQYSIIESEGRYQITVEIFLKKRYGMLLIRTINKDFFLLKDAQDWVSDHV